MVSRKLNEEIASQISYLGNKGFMPKQIRHRLKSVLSRRKLPSLKVDVVKNKAFHFISFFFLQEIIRQIKMKNKQKRKHRKVNKVIIDYIHVREK